MLTLQGVDYGKGVGGKEDDVGVRVSPSSRLCLSEEVSPLKDVVDEGLHRWEGAGEGDRRKGRKRETREVGRGECVVMTTSAAACSRSATCSLSCSLSPCITPFLISQSPATTSQSFAFSAKDESQESQESQEWGPFAVQLFRDVSRHEKEKERDRHRHR